MFFQRLIEVYEAISTIFQPERQSDHGVQCNLYNAPGSLQEEALLMCDRLTDAPYRYNFMRWFRFRSLKTRIRAEYGLIWDTRPRVHQLEYHQAWPTVQGTVSPHKYSFMNTEEELVYVSNMKKCTDSSGSYVH